MNNYTILNLSAYTSPEIKENKRKNWVEYDGNDREYKNNYFQYLIDRSVGSTTNGAIINGISRMIYGKGLSALDASKKIEQYAAMESLIRPNEVKKIIYDRKLFGMAAIQVTMERGRVTSITHFPMQTLRPEIANEDGDIEKWYYHPDWANKKTSEEPEVFDAYGFGGDTGNKIYIVKRYVAGYHYFSPPEYSGALPYAVLEEEIGDFLVNDVLNHFSGTKVINFNNGVPDSEEKRKAIERDVKNKVTGATGMRVIVAFNDGEDKKTTVEDIPLDNAPDHYTYLSEECFGKLIEGHGVTSPMMLGIRKGNDGLGNNADEIRTASLLMDNLTIKPLQAEIIEALKEILANNDISLKLYFKTWEPLEWVDPNIEDAETVQEETGVELSMDELRAFIAKGEDIPEDWEVIDEREVDYEIEAELDSQVQQWREAAKTNLKKNWFQKLISTGRANTNRKSEQDAYVGDNYYRVRYRYDKPLASTADEVATAARTGRPTKHRPFCTAMMAANKLYRKEDIIALEDKAVNPGFGENGSDTYSIWKYKGGAQCSHRWIRVTFKNSSIFKSISEGDQISNAQAEREGYRIRNPKEVSQPPRFMPKNGYK